MRASLLVLCLITAFPATGVHYDFLDEEIREVLKYRKGRVIGGIYEGKARPFYVDDVLYVQPVEAIVHGKPSCATRNLLQLSDKRRSLEFRNKFDILLRSWIGGRDVVLIGTSTCSPRGDEIIFGVIPR